MGKAAGRESFLPAPITNHCRLLVPLGAGPVVGVKGRPLLTRPMAVWHHLKRLQRYNSERWAHSSSQEWRNNARSGGAPKENQPTCRTTTRSNRSDAQAKEGRMPAISMQGQSCQKGRAEACSTEWRNPMEAQQHLRQGEGPCSSHHPSDAPRPGARKLGRSSSGCGFALHTTTDNAPHARRWAGGCGTAAPGATQDTPPTPATPGTQGRVRAARLRTPGGAPSAKRPKRHRQAPASRGLAFKRGRGHPEPPPTPRSRHEWSCTTRSGMGVQEQRSLKPHPTRGSGPGEAPRSDPGGRLTGRRTHCTLN